ncbi:MAG: Rieske 2Fe-2S domain-containing protein [Deltaproteobacteria bacterium]|nr:Rieske 2Fe-2S domain-containing protein [Deltaproteobacteria bacterium]
MAVEEIKPTRRGFLEICIGFMGAIFSLGIFSSVFSYLIPPSRKKGGDIVKIPIAELPLGGMKRFHVRGGPAVVINGSKGYAAYSLVCSHLGCLVKWEGDKNEFVCPCHGAKFDVEGNVISGPPPKGLEKLTLEEKEDEVWVS